MAVPLGVRCLQNAKNWRLPQFSACSYRLVSDAVTPISQVKHSSALPFRFLDLCYRPVVSHSFTPARGVKLSSFSFCENEMEKLDDSQQPVDPSKDRSKVIPPEVSIRYMKSKAYRSTYGDEAVWVKYRRNFKGQRPPPKTRRSCIKNGVLRTGNPCPICRDEYLVVHYSNVELINQFICPHTGEVYPAVKTNVCREKQFCLEVAIEQAKDLGLLTFEVPFRTYNYEEYYPQLQKWDKA